MVAFSVKGQIQSIEVRPGTEDYRITVLNGYYKDRYSALFIGKELYRKACDLHDIGVEVDALMTLAPNNGNSKEVKSYVLILEDIQPYKG